MSLTRDEVLGVLAVIVGTGLFALAFVWLIDWIGGDKK